jgi:hypothetical protein
MEASYTPKHDVFHMYYVTVLYYLKREIFYRPYRGSANQFETVSTYNISRYQFKFSIFTVLVLAATYFLLWCLLRTLRVT